MLRRRPPLRWWKCLPFEIPESDFSNWKNLDKFQVSIQSISNLDGPAAIYLDGMSLEVEYGKEHKDPKLFNISNIQNSEKLSLHVREDDSPDDKLIIASSGNTLGSVAIYKGGEDFPILTTFAIDFSYVADASYFGSGDFVILTNQNPATCDHLTIDECRESSDHIGEASFSISKNDVATSTESDASSTESTESSENASTSSETAE
jgi:hypothetical protein